MLTNGLGAYLRPAPQTSACICIRRTHSFPINISIFHVSPRLGEITTPHQPPSARAFLGLVLAWQQPLNCRILSPRHAAAAEQDILSVLLSELLHSSPNNKSLWTPKKRHTIPQETAMVSETARNLAIAAVVLAVLLCIARITYWLKTRQKRSVEADWRENESGNMSVWFPNKRSMPC